jgi:hypothetical protein
MADFIFLEPSCDIHLVLDPNFKRNGNPLNNLKLTAFEGIWNIPQTNPPRVSRDFTINAVPPGAIAVEFYPAAQNNVQYDAHTGLLTPQHAGEVSMQVVYPDPGNNTPDRHHSIVARIQVHDTMNGWWFGNNSLSVFMDPVLAHSQASIYALFDETAPDEGLVGDITGHGYIELTSNNVPVFDKVAKYRDRIQGKAVGAGKLRGELNTPMLTQAQELDVEVIDFPGAPVPLLEPHDVDFNKPRIEQFNMLFLAEGFTAAEKDVFDALVTNVVKELRENARHSPYNHVGDSFNIWKAFKPSKERGITMSRELMATGEHRGGPIPFKFSVEGSISLPELLEIAGYPRLKEGDHRKTPAVLRQAWKEPTSDASLAGYKDEQVKDEVIEEWKASHSEGIVQARDSFYGLRYSARLGERLSSLSNSAPITPATPPANGVSPFVQLIHQWFTPDLSLVIISEDWRRFAPELRYSVLIENNVGKLRANSLGNLILDHIAQLTVAPAQGVTGTDFNVGQLWHENLPAAGTAATREANSVGLVCILVNDVHVGGAMFNNTTLLAVPLDEKLQIASAIVRPTPNVRQLNRQLDTDLPFDPNNADDLKAKRAKLGVMCDVAAHEFGHALVLGDEYEERGGVGSKLADLFDNLTFYDEISVVPPTPLGQEPKIDPDKVKWLSLHRIVKSDSIIKKPERVSPTQIKVTLAPGRVTRWTDGEELLLRMQKGDVEFHRRQLPIDPNFDILQLQVDGAPDATNNTIVLKGNALPISVDDFRAGSVLLIPKRFRADALVKDAQRLTDTEMKITLDAGKVSRWTNGERVFLHSGSSDEVLELFITAVPSQTENTITLRTINFATTLPAELNNFRTGSLLADDRDYKDNAEKFLGERAVLDHMRNNHNPLSNNFQSSASNGCRPVTGNDDSAIDKPPRIGGMKQLCKDYRLVGLYEGGNSSSCRVYRPAGGCKMRNVSGKDGEGEFCFVCKYLIVNRIDATQHEKLAGEYPRPKK